MEIPNNPDMNKHKNLLSLLNSKNFFIITTHRNPDPDGIGAELGLSYLLKKMGKQHIILNPDPIYEKYKFLDPDKELSAYDPDTINLKKENITVIIVDNSDIPRIGNLAPLVMPNKSNLIVIDHHDDIQHFPGLFSYPNYAATSEIIFELIELAGYTLTPQIASVIYCGILMDTGQFKYSKTTSRTHTIASKLLSYSISTETLHRQLFEDYPVNVLLIKRDILNTLEILYNNQVAVISVRREALERYGYESSPVDGLVSELLAPKDIKIAVSFTEMKDGRVRISLRSKGSIDVCVVAKLFGGGGHKNASGALINLKLNELKAAALPHIEKLLTDIAQVQS